MSANAYAYAKGDKPPFPWAELIVMTAGLPQTLHPLCFQESLPSEADCCHMLSACILFK